MAPAYAELAEAGEGHDDGFAVAGHGGGEGGGAEGPDVVAGDEGQEEAPGSS